MLQAKEYAEQEFRLSEAQSDGNSLRSHLEVVHKATKVLPEQLQNLVALPDSIKEVWMYFLDLNSTRPSGFGISPISYSEMLAYFTLNDIQVNQEEVQLIRMFDNAAITSSREQEKKREKKAKK